MEKKGARVTYLPVSFSGAPTLSQIEEAILPETKLVVLSAVNTETGVKIDLSSIAAMLERRQIPLIVDAVAWMGKEPLFIPSSIVGMAFSGHKFHAPKGVGFVYLRSQETIEPLIQGGGQEASLRSGTENLLGIIGLAKAIELLKEELPLATIRMQELRDRLEKGLIEEISDVHLNGKGPRICNTSNLAFEGVEGEMLLMYLDQAGIAISHGSACSAGALEPSRILLNMGIPRKRASSSIRFSLSRFTTQEEIDACIYHTTLIVKKLRL
jgi:cysteine desulfurase